MQRGGPLDRCRRRCTRTGSVVITSHDRRPERLVEAPPRSACGRSSSVAAEEGDDRREVQLALLHDEVAGRQHADDVVRRRRRPGRRRCRGRAASAWPARHASSGREREDVGRHDVPHGRVRDPLRLSKLVEHGGQMVEQVAGDQTAARAEGLAMPCRKARRRRRATDGACASSAPMTPESTSPVPAVASRASPVAARGPARRGRRRPSSAPSAARSHRSPRRGRGPRRCGRPRRMAGEPLVLAVVRGQHGQWMRVAARRRRPSAVRPSPSTTTGTVDSFTDSAHRGASSPGPCRARTDDERPEPLEPVEHGAVPAELRHARCARPRSARRSRPTTRAGHAEPHVARARPLRAPRGERRGAGHARRPGDDPHRGPPLVRLGRARSGSQSATSHASTRCARAPATVEPDVGDLDRAGAARARVEHEPGLERGERHGRVGPHRAVRRLAGQPVDTRGDVDREHRRATGIGRVVLAAEPGAVGGVDHEVARAASRVPSAVAASTTVDTHARARSRRAASRPSLPLLPFPATTTTRRPYVPPSMPDRLPRDRRRRRGR